MSTKNARRIVAHRLPVTGANQFIEVIVRFDVGGLNYWDYKQKARGYYLSVSPVEDIVEDGRTIGHKYVMGTGVCSLIETALRFNAKRLAELAHGCFGLPAYNQLLDRVLRENRLELAVEAVA